MAHRSFADGPTGARTGGEPTGTCWGHRTHSARALLAARGSPTCATEACLLRNDECRWTIQCGRPWRLQSCFSSTRLSTSLLALRQIWSASSGKPASPMFVAALFVEALLVVVMYVHPALIVEYVAPARSSCAD